MKENLKLNKIMDSNIMIDFYTKLSNDLSDELNSKGFRFVEFNSYMENIELAVMKEDDDIVGYALLERADKMNQDLYMDMLYGAEDDCMALEEGSCDINYLNLNRELLTILKNKDFYYLSYMEILEQYQGKGCGSILASKVKDKYHKIVLVASGYTEENTSKDFWIKQGYKDMDSLMFNK